MNKSIAEILARIDAIKACDWLGFQTNDLIVFLPYAEAKPYLGNDMTQEEFESAVANIEEPLELARGYLSFAWGKANDRRGLSAGRSLEHLSAWLWLAGYGDVIDAHFPRYQWYGKWQLIIASVICGVDWKALDDGLWVSGEKNEPLTDAEISELIESAEAIAFAAKTKFAGALS